MPVYNPPVQIDDDGVPQGSVNRIDFTGAGVTATVVGDEATVDIPGSSGLTHPQVMARVSLGF